MLGEHEKNDPRKILLTNFKERPSKLEKGYSQVLVKQTVDLMDPINNIRVYFIRSTDLSLL